MRKAIGRICGAVLVAAFFVGVLRPEFGANPPMLVNLTAWAFYVALFCGLYWGALHD